MSPAASSARPPRQTARPGRCERRRWFSHGRQRCFRRPSGSGTGSGNGSGNGGTSVVINDGVYISLNPQTADDKFELPNPTLFPGRVYIIRNIQNGVTAQLITTTNLLFPKNSTVGSSQIYMYEGNLRTVIVISDGQNWTYIF